MYRKVVTNIFFITILSILQIGFIEGLPSYFSEVNILIISLIFVLALKGFRIAMWWSIGFSFLAGVYGFSIFNIFFIIFPLIVVISNLLYEQFFTDRSLYSYVILLFCSFVTYDLVILSFQALERFFIGKESSIIYNSNFWQVKLYGLLYNFVLVVLIFYTLNLIGKNLKPVFIRKRYEIK